MMKLFIVGIGGCGGKIAKIFLESHDIPIFNSYLGNYNCFGDIRGLWLEADVQETENLKFFKPASSLSGTYYPFYFIPHDVLGTESKTARHIQDNYGYDLKKQGFFRQAEYLKAIFELFDYDQELRRVAIGESGFDNPILRNTWKIIRPYTTVGETNDKDSENRLGLCDGILFIVSLGGGTGTGFINPITGYIRAERKEFPIFVLGILTEEGEDKQQGAKEEKRDLGAVISIYDLLTKSIGSGIDGLILADNQILMKKFEGNYDTINRFIYQSMKPLIAQRNYPGEDPSSLAVKEQFQLLNNLNIPPILIPCYWIDNGKGSSENDLIKSALNEGRLFYCDPKNADGAYIFARGFLSSEAIRKSVALQTNIPENNVQVWRKLGSRKNEILILLRNPYGSRGNYNVSGTFENRMYRIIEKSIRYIEANRAELIRADMPAETAEKLENYFYGQNRLLSNLKESLSRIENIRKEDKQIFPNELSIFSAPEVEDHTQLADMAIVPEEQLISIESRLLSIEKVLKEKGLINDGSQIEVP